MLENFRRYFSHYDPILYRKNASKFLRLVLSDNLRLWRKKQCHRMTFSHYAILVVAVVQYIIFVELK